MMDTVFKMQVIRVYVIIKSLPCKMEKHTFIFFILIIKLNPKDPRRGRVHANWCRVILQRPSPHVVAAGITLQRYEIKKRGHTVENCLLSKKKLLRKICFLLLLRYL